MSCSKRQKQFENGQKTDRISDLPETLLCHILSFVPTKSAVATSVLSRRWISVWTKVPVLDFTEFPISVSFSDRAKVSYNTFIKKVVLNNDMQSLQRFHFEVLVGSDMLCVSSLISSVLKREISEIYLTNQQVAANPNDVPLLLSVGLFYSERLKVLKLLGPFKISVLSNLHLPRVKTLYLHQLEFVGHDVLEILTSGCPALKEMVIEYCKGLKKLYIDSLTLDRLKIDRLETTNTRKMMVDVKVPNVSFLDLDFDVSFGEIEYDVSDLSSIVEARISICSGEASKQPWALELIRRISHAQRLWLSESTADLFAQVSENDLPMFPNLTVLEIQIAHSMFQMLKFAPKLRHLIVDVGRSIEESQPFPPDIVPHCLSSLPIVGIRDFEGLEHDSELVKYILKNAKVLEELKIHMHEASINQERDAYKKLLSFPRVSSTCQVITCSSCGDNAP